MRGVAGLPPVDLAEVWTASAYLPCAACAMPSTIGARWDRWSRPWPWRAWPRLRLPDTCHSRTAASASLTLYMAVLLGGRRRSAAAKVFLSASALASGRGKPVPPCCCGLHRIAIEGRHGWRLSRSARRPACGAGAPAGTAAGPDRCSRCRACPWWSAPRPSSASSRRDRCSRRPAVSSVFSAPASSFCLTCDGHDHDRRSLRTGFLPAAMAASISFCASAVAAA